MDGTAAIQSFHWVMSGTAAIQSFHWAPVAIMDGAAAIQSIHWAPCGHHERRSGHSKRSLGTLWPS